MGTGTLVAIVVITAFAAVAVVAVQWSRRAFKRAGEDHPPDARTDAGTRAAAVRLTSGALRGLASPPWRVVYEIGADRLTGAEHVLIGPPGAFAVTTRLEPLPVAGPDEPDRHAVAAAALTRGGLDDALRRVRLASTCSLIVHWGGADPDAPPAVAGVHGVIHVDGRRLGAWAAELTDTTLSPGQVDLAWQTVVTAIGRPDPLA